MLPSPPLLNRAGFISRQRTLGVSLGNLHLPSNLSAVFHPSCYKQNQTGSYKFSKANSPWWSQPIHPLQPRGLPAAPAASCQPSPLPLKPTHSCLNPASSLLTSISPLIALNIQHSFPNHFHLPFSFPVTTSKSVPQRSGVLS